MGYRLHWKSTPDGRWLRSCLFETADLALLTTSARGERAYAWKVLDEDDQPGWQNANRWFGEPWPFPDLPAPICEDYRLHISTPVHTDCVDCREPILPSESGTQMPFLDTDGPKMVYQHAECGVRQVMCPIDMGLVKDISGRHQHDDTQRRHEARLLMQMIQSQVARERM